MDKNFKPLHQIQTVKGQASSGLLEEFEKCGAMQAGALGKAMGILEEMIKEKDCKVFMGVAGALVPGGLRNTIADFLREEWIDALVITGANLTHDLVEALGERHLTGSAGLNDKELHKQGLDRIYNALMPNKAYIKMEKFIKAVIQKMPQNVSGKEFLWELGKGLKDKNSILRIAFEKKIPIYCPALTDCGIGLQAMFYLKGKKIDLWKDLREFNEMVWEAKRKGVFYVGGGVPKNFIQQAMQFSPRPADFAVQITTSRPESGGSSGAELKESISWGKLSEKAKFVNVYADATICLPLLSAALKERI
jgi:deoxyhypusine synthase